MQPTTRRAFLASLLGLAVAAGASDSFAGAAGGQRRAETLDVGGVRRTYVLRLPTKYDGKTAMPLVIMLHGRGGNARNAERAYGWPEKGETEGFVTAFADALPDRQGKPAWNAGYNAGLRTVDDVAFLRALIAHLKKTLAIDPKRVYVCGHSSGGMMSHRLGAELGGEIAAIGVCAGSIGSTAPGGRKTVIATPKSPVSVIHIHGRADEIVPYDSGRGGERSAFALDFVPAPESAAFWAKANGCAPTPRRETSFGGNVVRETWTGGKGGTDVVLISIGNGNHMWPGMAGRRRGGTANRQVDATDAMWEFFKAHPRR